MQRGSCCHKEEILAANGEEGTRLEVRRAPKGDRPSLLSRTSGRTLHSLGGQLAKEEQRTAFNAIGS